MADERVPGFDPAPICTMADVGCETATGGERVVMCEQHTAEWLNIRRGAITASQAHNIIGIRGEPSKSTGRERYLNELGTERITGQPVSHWIGKAGEDGIEREPLARDWYAKKYGPVTEVGFVWRTEERSDIGCSPDGVCRDRLLEIKCRTDPVHFGFARRYYKLEGKNQQLAIPVKDRLQMQFQMWVCGVGLCDYLAWTPQTTNLPNIVITVSADASLHAEFDTTVIAFADAVAEAVEAIKQGGFSEKRGKPDSSRERGSNRQIIDCAGSKGADVSGDRGADSLF